METLRLFGVIFGSTIAGLLAGAAVVHLVGRLGSAGKRIATWMCAGFPLDCIVFYFTVLPMILGPVFAGWIGLAAAIAGQYTALILWEIAHELWHYKTKGRAAILRETNKIAGTANNLFACFWTSLAVPIFALTRFAEYVVYLPLTWTVGLPRYDSRKWVNVSRQKFTGLVGHDRIWCLYCDWMTGVWSLATEMLRNVESFWCPIRFQDASKCANCRTDFPDVATHWIDFEKGTAEDAAALIHDAYAHTDGSEAKPRAWMNHPIRESLPVQLTVKGQVRGESANLPS